ncbi:MAG: MORN repeat-containing protein [Massilia sp.]
MPKVLTMPSSRAIFLVSLLYGAASHAQEPQPYIGATDCRIAPVSPPPAEAVNWSGKCKDGYAEDHGVLEWRAGDKARYSLDATLVRGQIQGEATLKSGDIRTYVGTFRNGVPHGKGYFKNAQMQYEGDVVNGKPEGNGVVVYDNGDRYEGQWKDGLRDGSGRITYMLGGSYEGQWKRGKRDGKGVLVYAGSGRRYEGEFTQGRVAGTLPPPKQAATSYSLKSDLPVVGSNIPYDIARGSDVPLNVGYAELTPEQQRLVRSHFPALEDGDEPPYPLHGVRQFFDLVSKAVGRSRIEGDLRLWVTVGADGEALSVASVGQVDEKMKYFVAAAAMSVKYKPAVCRGKPCQMLYPFRLRLQPEM